MVYARKAYPSPPYHTVCFFRQNWVHQQRIHSVIQLVRKLPYLTGIQSKFIYIVHRDSWTMASWNLDPVKCWLNLHSLSTQKQDSFGKACLIRMILAHAIMFNYDRSPTGWLARRTPRYVVGTILKAGIGYHWKVQYLSCLEGRGEVVNLKNM